MVSATMHLASFTALSLPLFTSIISARAEEPIFESERPLRSWLDRIQKKRLNSIVNVSRGSKILPVNASIVPIRSVDEYYDGIKHSKIKVRPQAATIVSFVHLLPDAGGATILWDDDRFTLSQVLDETSGIISAETAVSVKGKFCGHT
jgi:hypothetical protein